MRFTEIFNRNSSSTSSVTEETLARADIVLIIEKRNKTMTTVVSEKRIIVTGGAKGLGYALIQQLLQKGAKSVAILDCNAALGVESAVELNAKFGDNRAFFIPCDVTNPDKFEAAFKTAIKKLGGLDILVNNAGIFNEIKWNQTVDVNLKGVIQGTVLAVELMGKHNNGNGGVVLNMSSITGIKTSKFFPVYVSTKAAVVAFSESVSESFKKTGVAVKVICPNPASTDIVLKMEEKVLSFVDKDEVLEMTSNCLYLSPETIAKTMLRMIEEAPNGAVWYKPHGKPPVAVISLSLESKLAPIS